MRIIKFTYHEHNIVIVFNMSTNLHMKVLIQFNTFRVNSLSFLNIVIAILTQNYSHGFGFGN